MKMNQQNELVKTRFYRKQRIVERDIQRRNELLQNSQEIAQTTIPYDSVPQTTMGITPNFSKGWISSNTANFSDWNDYNRDFTPTPIRSLQIKQAYKPLSKDEQKQLLFWERTRNKKALAEDAETSRNNRMIFGEVNKNLRHWF